MILTIKSTTAEKAYDVFMFSKQTCSNFYAMHVTLDMLMSNLYTFLENGSTKTFIFDDGSKLHIDETKHCVSLDLSNVDLNI